MLLLLLTSFSAFLFLLFNNPVAAPVFPLGRPPLRSSVFSGCDPPVSGGSPCFNASCSLPLCQDFHLGIHLISCYPCIYQLSSLNNAFGSTILRPLTTYSEHNDILFHLKYYLSLCYFSSLYSKKIRVVLFVLHRMSRRIDRHIDAAEAAEETRQ